MNRQIFRSFVFMVLVFLVSGGPGSECAAGEQDKGNTRVATVAGRFYPGSPKQLRRTVATFLDGVPEIKPSGEVLAAIAPHAGYVYSGGVAAYTYKSLSTVDFDTLVIIGHDTYQNAVAFTCPVDYFQTPLGKVPVDRAMMAKMHDFDRGIKPHPSLHANDHTVEVQLPFLQVVGRQCKIIPILFGNPTVRNARILSDAILHAAGNKTVFVLASSDLSHYPPYKSARKIDGATLEILTSLDVTKIFTHLERQERETSVPDLRTTMCAKGGVGTAILFAEAHGADHVRVLHYTNSGDVPAGDKRRVVGYGSVLMMKRTADASK